MMMLEMVSWLLLALACWPILYLAVLALLAWAPRRVKGYPEPSQRFAVVVPAHNEEIGIADTIASLKRLDYPIAHFEIIVIADNCSDNTAPRARQAGARVLERQHATKRGKGYALEFAFEHLLQHQDYSAIVVVDADTVVSSNLLRAFDRCLGQGARAAQAHYGVSNPLASWRTRLMSIALGMFHRTRSLGRERLGLSVGLRGNGMCFAAQTLRDHPHRAYGLVEDVEYGLTLGLAGHRIAYATEACVWGEMVSGAKASESQRQRWEGGRMALLKSHLANLLRQGLVQRCAMVLDLAADLVIPPLSSIALLLGLGLALEAALVWQLSGLTLRSGLWLGAMGCFAIYVLRGMQYSGLGLRAIDTMLFAPIYILWKVFVVWPRRKASSVWVRTMRQGER